MKILVSFVFKGLDILASHILLGVSAKRLFLLKLQKR